MLRATNLLPWFARLRIRGPAAAQLRLLLISNKQRSGSMPNSAPKVTGEITNLAEKTGGLRGFQRTRLSFPDRGRVAFAYRKALGKTYALGFIAYRTLVLEATQSRICLVCLPTSLRNRQALLFRPNGAGSFAVARQLVGCFSPE